MGVRNLSPCTHLPHFESWSGKRRSVYHLLAHPEVRQIYEAAATAAVVVARSLSPWLLLLSSSFPSRFQSHSDELSTVMIGMIFHSGVVVPLLGCTPEKK